MSETNPTTSRAAPTPKVVTNFDELVFDAMGKSSVRATKWQV
jgi:hypothetical protein